MAAAIVDEPYTELNSLGQFVKRFIDLEELDLQKKEDCCLIGKRDLLGKRCRKKVECSFG